MQSLPSEIHKAIKVHAYNAIPRIHYDHIERAYIMETKCYEELSDIPTHLFYRIQSYVDPNEIVWSYKRHVFCVENNDPSSVQGYREFENNKGDKVYYKST